MTETTKAKTVISEKPYPLPIEMRPLWRICLIVIALVMVSGDKRYLDIRKVNILVWMLIRRTRWKEYELFLHDHTRDIPFVSIDSAMYKAVEFAIAKNLVTLEAGRLYTTSNAENMHCLIVDNKVLEDEIEFLATNGKKLSERKVKELMGGLL